MSCCVHARAQLATLYRSSSSTRSCVFVALGICVVDEARAVDAGRSCVQSLTGWSVVGACVRQGGVRGA